MGDRDADALEGFDHFVGGFRTEVLDFEEVFIAEAHQVRHGVDLGALEAVVGPNRKVQFLKRNLCFRRGLGFSRNFLHESDRGQWLEQLNQLIGRLSQGVVGRPNCRPSPG